MKKKSKRSSTAKKALKTRKQNEKKLVTYRKLRNKGGGSIGEDVIEMHLKMLKYNYRKEFKVAIDGYDFRFDFAIFDLDRLLGFIEFDGVQHFEPVEKFGGSEGLRKTKFRDTIKDNYCESNGLLLLRIRYSDGHESKNMIKEKYPVSRRKYKKKKDNSISLNEFNEKFKLTLTQEEVLQLIEDERYNEYFTRTNLGITQVGVNRNKKLIRYISFRTHTEFIRIELNHEVKRVKGKKKSIKEQRKNYVGYREGWGDKLIND